MPSVPAESMPSIGGSTEQPARPYRVLARTYRPQRLSELIGQDALVRTLTNALHSGRVAHAFLLTGIRGVGKTTTARIIARALNCIGPDGSGQPTPEPCGQCEPCVAIAEGRHIDVLEMDAATRTGIDDIREIVDSVRYAPTSARTKVYIIDEVHMLSEKAFNGLLKTLEEPPPQTIFIFATTEVRKVPVTVLSRCQRFDLRRVEGELLQRHLGEIAAKEGVQIEPGALALIVRAAEGSVRDGLSLLDQAIALAGGEAIAAAQVQAMLGLADRSRVLDLFEHVARGAIKDALDCLAELYALGTEPEAVLQDLLEISHWLTRIKLAPQAAEGLGVAQQDVVRGRVLAEALGMPELARAWQMLLKGLEDVRLAPSPLLATEMVLVRLAYAAELPPPAELVRRLGDGSEARTSGPPAPAQPDAPAPTRPKAPEAPVSPGSFAEEVALFEQVTPNVPEAPPAVPDHLVDPGDRLGWEHDATIIGAPGHTAGHVAAWFQADRVLIAGDALASHDGRPMVGVFNADPTLAAASARRLASLDADIACFGHGEPLRRDAAASLAELARG